MLPQLVINDSESITSILSEQKETLLRVEGTLNQSLIMLTDLNTSFIRQLDAQLLLNENTKFAQAEAAREAARSAAAVANTNRQSTSQQSEGSSRGIGGLGSFATGLAGGMVAGGVAGTLRMLAGRLVTGGGLAAVGLYFGEEIGKFLQTEADSMLDDAGLSSEFTDKITTGLAENLDTALIAGGLSKVIFGRTLPGLIAGFVLGGIDIEKLFSTDATVRKEFYDNLGTELETGWDALTADRVAAASIITGAGILALLTKGPMLKKFAVAAIAGYGLSQIIPTNENVDEFSKQLEDSVANELELLGFDPANASTAVDAGGAALTGLTSGWLFGLINKRLKIPAFIAGFVWDYFDLARIFDEEGKNELGEAATSSIRKILEGEGATEDYIDATIAGLTVLGAAKMTKNIVTKGFDKLKTPDIDSASNAPISEIDTPPLVQQPQKLVPPGDVDTKIPKVISPKSPGPYIDDAPNIKSTNSPQIQQAPKLVTPNIPPLGQTIGRGDFRRSNGQFMSDAEIEEYLSKQIKDARMARVFKRVVSGLAVLGVVLAARDLYILQNLLNSDATPEVKQAAVGNFIGGYAGGFAGSVAGGAALAFFGPWGVLIGAILGGVAGGLFGGEIGTMVAKWAFEEDPPAQTDADYEAFLQQNRDKITAQGGIAMVYEGVTGANDGSIQRTTPSYAEQYGPSSPHIELAPKNSSNSNTPSEETIAAQNILANEIAELASELIGLESKREIEEEKLNNTKGRNRRSVITRVQNINREINALKESIEGLNESLERLTEPTLDGASYSPNYQSKANLMQASFTPGFAEPQIMKASLVPTSQASTSRNNNTSSASNDVDLLLETIKAKESSGNYTATNFAWDDYIKSGGKNGSSATGAYQFIQSTWKGLTEKYGVGAEYAYAKDAPPAIQDLIARNYVIDILKNNNGDVRAVPNTWYTGNAAGRMSAKSLAVNNGMTSQEYSNDWLSRYAEIGGGAVAANIDTSDIDSAQATSTDSMMASNMLGGSKNTFNPTSSFDKYFNSANPEEMLAKQIGNMFGSLGVSIDAVKLNTSSEKTSKSAPVVINAPQVVTNDQSVSTSSGGQGRSTSSQARAINVIGELSATSTMRDWVDATFA